MSRLRERANEERQREPGDYEALAGPGSFTAHHNGHLASSDAGVVRYSRRLKQETEKVSCGSGVLQPTAHGTTPIPTYGSDTVLRLPVPSNGEDHDAVAELLKQVAAVYQSADNIPGESRFDYLARELARLTV